MAHDSDNSDLASVRVRLPDEIIRILDALVERGLFSNRSEAIREFARQYAIEHEGRR